MTAAARIAREVFEERWRDGDRWDIEARSSTGRATHATSNCLPTDATGGHSSSAPAPACSLGYSQGSRTRSCPWTSPDRGERRARRPPGLIETYRISSANVGFRLAHEETLRGQKGGEAFSVLLSLFEKP